jgi:hypothetical protein
VEDAGAPSLPGQPAADANALAAFISGILETSPHPPLGPNDPPEWRREPGRSRFTEESFRLLTGKTRGEFTRLDALTTALSYMIPMGRFVPPAGQAPFRSAIAAATQAAKIGDMRTVLRSLDTILHYIPTYAPMSMSEVLRYGRFPTRRVIQGEQVVGGIVEAARRATDESAPPIRWPGIPMP